VLRGVVYFATFLFIGFLVCVLAVFTGACDVRRFAKAYRERGLADLPEKGHRIRTVKDGCRARSVLTGLQSSGKAFVKHKKQGTPMSNNEKWAASG
jgi:hypothetical protein